MTRPRNAERDVIGSRKPVTAGLPMWQPLELAMFNAVPLMTEPMYLVMDQPPSNRSNTSQDAALQIVPHAMGLRERVYRYVQSRGAYGATRSEISVSTAIKKDTCNGRTAELLQIGLFRMEGTRHGESIVVCTEKPFHAGTVAADLRRMRLAKDMSK